MSKHPPTSFGFQRSFSVFEEFVESAVAWDLDFRQLSAETAGTVLTQIGAGGLLLTYAGLGCHCDQRGGSPKGFRTFALPAEGSTTFTWGGRNVSAESLIVFGRGGEFEASSRPGFRVYTLSIAESILEKSPARERLPALDTDGGAVLECSPGAVSNLRELLAPVLNPAMPLNGTGLNGLLSTVQESLPHLIGEAVTGGGKRKPVRLTRSTRQSVIARVTGHVRDNDDAPASVGGLSRELGISERTLHRALKDHFGVGPKEYLRALRLNRVRRELRRADPGASQVREIALRFGFWHASQFAADYWRLFGELPSETLARRA